MNKSWTDEAWEDFEYWTGYYSEVSGATVEEVDNVCRFNFKLGEDLYVVDYDRSKENANLIVLPAKAVAINCTTKTVDVKVDGKFVRTYRFNDFGRIVFDNYDIAEFTSRVFPKPGTVVKQKIGKRYYTKTIEGYGGRLSSDSIFDLVFRMNKGKDVTTRAWKQFVFSVNKHGEMV